MGLRIHAICVSVNYAEHLARSIETWSKTLESLTVVTDTKDDRTAELAYRYSVELHRTQAFYEDGAFFNKGRAIEEVRTKLYERRKRDWHLLIDADVVPPTDWLDIVTAAKPRVGVLHGARRIRAETGEPINDSELAGFFQLYHFGDMRAIKPLATNFIHGGNYDSDFMLRWPRQAQRILDLTLTHHGEVGTNWCGVGNDEAMAEIRAQRRRGRHWRQEVIKP